jgi:hypothetical protein
VDTPALRRNIARINDLRSIVRLSADLPHTALLCVAADPANSLRFCWCCRCSTADAAKRRVAELEDENRRQRAALRSRSEEAVHAQREALQAQKQLKQLSAQVRRSSQLAATACNLAVVHS